MPETRYVLKRKGKFLQEDYYWGLFPHSFPEWHFAQIFPLTMQYKDRPTEVGELKDGTLENAIWKDLR